MQIYLAISRRYMDFDGYCNLRGLYNIALSRNECLLNACKVLNLCRSMTYHFALKYLLVIMQVLLKLEPSTKGVICCKRESNRVRPGN
jgi:hypothetical protein